MEDGGLGKRGIERLKDRIIEVLNDGRADDVRNRSTVGQKD